MKWVKIGFMLLGTALAITFGACWAFRRTSADAGFIHGPCKGGTFGEYRWADDATPVPVYVQMEGSSEAPWLDPIVRAQQRWNTEVDWAVFADPLPFPDGMDDERDGVVLVVFFNSDGSETEGKPSTSFVVDEHCTIRRVLIRLPSRLAEERRQQAVTHEFGHAAGLDHDPMEQSIMNDGGRASSFGMDIITRADAERLREAYR